MKFTAGMIGTEADPEAWGEGCQETGNISRYVRRSSFL